jgi:hypothetical protein
VAYKYWSGARVYNGTTEGLDIITCGKWGIQRSAGEEGRPAMSTLEREGGPREFVEQLALLRCREDVVEHDGTYSCCLSASFG